MISIQIHEPLRFCLDRIYVKFEKKIVSRRHIIGASRRPRVDLAEIVNFSMVIWGKNRTVIVWPWYKHCTISCGLCTEPARAPYDIRMESHDSHIKCERTRRSPTMPEKSYRKS